MMLAGVPFIPQIFLEYQQEELKDKNVLVTSGLMTTNEVIEAKFAMGGKTVDLPFFGDLAGDDEVLSDTVGLTATTIGGNFQTGVRLMRGKSWKTSDLAKELSGADPMQAIAASTGRFWRRKMQQALIASIRGLFGTGGPLASTHAVGGTATQLSADVMIDGFAQLGDAGDELTGIFMHSRTFYRLMKLDLIVPATSTSVLDTRLSAERLERGTYLGRPVFVDDTIPVESGAGTGGGSGKDVLQTYFFGPGAFAYASAPAENPVETDRDPSVGVDYLFNRTHYMVHPNGISWIGNSQNQGGPSNSELATGSNWEKVFADNRNIRVTQLRAYI